MTAPTRQRLRKRGESMEEKKTAPLEEGAESKIRTIRSVKLEEVIEVEVLYGVGTEENPYRIAAEYWSKEGELLAVRDPIV